MIRVQGPGIDYTYRPSNAERDVRRRRAQVCPVCQSPHPADTWCKPREKADNGYRLTDKPY